MSVEKNKITYLLGAGASANTVPTIAKFQEDLEGMRDFFIDPLVSRMINPVESKLRKGEKLKQSLNTFIIHLNELIDVLPNYHSIDTMARKFYLSSDTLGYNALKTMVNFFLTYKQLEKGLDNRYDAFFGTVLDKEGTDIIFPKINILSWNYDFQMELSLSNFYKNLTELGALQSEIGIHPNLVDSSPVRAIKLNGTAMGYFENDGVNITNLDLSKYGSNLNQEELVFLCSHMIDTYPVFSNRSSITPTIMYSWEDNNTSKALFEKAKTLVSGTTDLIIIGYSFPFINREKDKAILKAMSNSCGKIYIQNTKENIDDVMERFDELKHGITRAKVIPKTAKDEFFIPNSFVR